MQCLVALPGSLIHIQCFSTNTDLALHQRQIIQTEQKLCSVWSLLFYNTLQMNTFCMHAHQNRFWKENKMICKLEECRNKAVYGVSGLACMKMKIPA